ncbi:MAG: outer membrane lipid asymmetry maintenance protein MlaD [Alphaproteobacteria bacterium]|nr:outer membrane lipid asymmetry maintenance protein MlaD [Alphaproteobacteria bacterium]
MQKNIVETLMGAVVLLVAASFFIFAYNKSDVRMEDGYKVSAKFDNASGVALGSDVRVGGVKVGVVSDIALDPETFQAVVTLQIRNSAKLPKDSSASITGDGLLGGKYVQVIPGGDEETLASGETIEYTQSAVNLEELIGKFVFSGGGADKKPDTAPAESH